MIETITQKFKDHHTIRQLRVVFQNQIKPHEINLMRGAIGNLMRQGSDLFHNHTHEGLRYAYPMIQYKIIGGKAAIVCLNEGVDAIYDLLSIGALQFRLGTRVEEFKVAQFTQEDFQLRILERPQSYDLNSWFSLNETNYRKFIQCERAEDQVRLLESILTSNQLEFFKGMGWRVPQRIQTQIVEIQDQYPLKHKGVGLLAFNLTFSTNVLLPSFIGLGKASSSGHGVLRPSKLNIQKLKQLNTLSL
jgi:hypothetical protein